jgi:pimeloyl-ACP methyl ester carboxylesterase
VATIEPQKLEVLGRPAVVHAGGAGDAVVLIHGGWGGAAMHWHRVWIRLAEQFRVLAPELPGVGDLSQRGLGGVTEYARWIEALLDAAGVDGAALVGNSFGAAIAWELAARSPSRCRALVLVNGTPLPRTPRWLGALGTWPPTRRLLQGVFRRNTFSRRARDQAFAFPERLPCAMRGVFEDPVPPQLDALFEALGRGGNGAAPARRPLLLWGEADRFPASDARALRKLRASLPGAELALVPAAGHLPQLESPELFLGALVPFLRSELGAPTTPAP